MEIDNNFNELDKEHIIHEHKLKYGDLWRHAMDILSLSYCISEFVDNSISSCESTYWNKGIQHELIIDINYYQEGSIERYEIIDNAGGMDSQELNNAMIFGNKRYRNDNSYKNQYGIGMKTAIFWIGKDAEIFTKTSSDTEYCGQYLAKNRDDNDSVVHRISKSDGYNLKNFISGTKIVIYGSNGGNRTMTKRQLEYTCFFLGNRYSKYLNDNRSNNIFKCTININSKIGRKNIHEKVKKITIENSGTTKVFKYIENVTCNKNKEEIKRIIQNETNIDQKLSSIKGDYQYEEFVNKLLNGKELIFDDILVITSSKDKNIKYKAPIKLYLLERGDKYSSGVGIVHSNRYIFHPVLLDKERKEHLAGLYEPFDMKQYEDRGKWIRVDLDISKIESNENCQKIYPEKNKTRLIFAPDSDIIEESVMSSHSFKGGLRAVFFKWIPFVSILRKITSIDSPNKIKAKDLHNEEIGVIANNENVEIDLKISSENNEQKNVKYFFNNDKNIKVIIEIISIENNYYLINNEKIDVDEETGITTYRYKYNVNNQYFSKIKKVSDMSYILKLLLYLDIYYNQNNIKTKKVSEVINDALKFWSDEE